jgi:crossover junction endodeoxyribonuclease RusA
VTRIILDDIDPQMLRDATSNKRHHWTRRNSVTHYWRVNAHAAGLKAGVPGFTAWPVHVTVTIRWPDNRKRDPGNWAPLAKACVDGMTAAGWWPDDDHTHVIGPDLRRDPVNGPVRVVVDVEEVL